MQLTAAVTWVLSAITNEFRTFMITLFLYLGHQGGSSGSHIDSPNEEDADSSEDPPLRSVDHFFGSRVGWVIRVSFSSRKGSLLWMCCYTPTSRNNPDSRIDPRWRSKGLCTDVSTIEQVLIASSVKRHRIELSSYCGNLITLTI